MNATTNIYQPADRIAGFKPYYFVELNAKIARLRANGIDVIRLDMGSPDLPPADFIIDAMVASARKPGSHGYSAIGGTPAYRQAVAQYYLNRFSVELDPDSEVLGLIGSKEGLFNLSQSILNPGDFALIPDPGYPVYTAGTVIAGGQVYPMPLLAENQFLPDLDSIPAGVLDKAKILWLNYPNNPTGASAPMSFFTRVVDFARKHHLLIAHDAPYTEVCFDGYRAPSLLQVPGANDVAVEFNSLSKAYNMGGWRLGMMVGNPRAVKYVSTLKSQMDTSTFEPLLAAGAAALTGDQQWLIGRNQIYQERRDIIIDAVRKAGLSAQTPPAS
ncbi:MAG TPA: aminotransferase class I/II-fold pyridoxal phosphate-dependent enzyme, partial [Anaerolineales bacterium]